METTLLHPKQLEAKLKLVPVIQKGSGAIVWWKMGEGKSRLAIATYFDLRFLRPGACIIVCRKKALETWKEEIKKVKNNVLIQELPNKCLMVSRFRPTFWLVSHAMIGKFLNRFKSCPINFIIYDECYLYSNHKSKRSIAARSLTQLSNGRCIGLSGTIMSARDTLSIWGQTVALGMGYILARSTTEFYTEYKKCFLVDYGRGSVQQFIDKPNAKERILEKLSKFTHIHFPKETRSIRESFHDLPLSLNQFKAIQQLKDEYYIAMEKEGFELELRSALELVIKVSQIANGWCKNQAGQIVSFPSPKLDALVCSLQESYEIRNRRIVWCHFQQDLEHIQGELEFECLKMSGKHSFDLDKWKSGKFPIVLATMGSGSSVNHFRNVEHASIFSYTLKHLDYTQSMARTNRFDSAHSSCAYSHFRARGTFDDHIFKLLTKTGDIEKDFIRKGIVKQWLQSSPASK